MLQAVLIFSASVGLLEAKLVKNQTEMSTEQNLEQTLVESLKQAELVHLLLLLLHTALDSFIITLYLSSLTLQV